MRLRILWAATAIILVGIYPSGDLPAQQREQTQDFDRAARQRAERSEPDPGGERSDRQREGDRQSDSARLLPPRPERERYWYLGVEVEYRDYGAQISKVERQSPAARAGLEVRDVIVTVNGYQVGRVIGRLYSLDRELELRADRRGRVTLLVQNRRNGQLTPLPVRLEPAQRQRDPLRSQPIIGTISMRRISSLARGALLTVRLLDVTDRRLPARALAQRTYRELGPLPIPFELSYDTDDIEPGRKYALDAEVTVNGFAAYRSPQRLPVLETERQGRVNLVLEPVRR